MHQKLDRYLHGVETMSDEGYRGILEAMDTGRYQMFEPWQHPAVELQIKRLPPLHERLFVGLTLRT
jgi:hypothetical protein